MNILCLTNGLCLGADDTIGLDEIAKEIFPVEVIGLWDRFPVGAFGDASFAVDIPENEIVFVFVIAVFCKDFEVVAGWNGFDGIPGGCCGGFKGSTFAVFRGRVLPSLKRMY